MFLFSGSFNGDLSRWDTSAVTDMSSMFHSASSFNGDLSCWVIGAGTATSAMCNGAGSCMFSDENYPDEMCAEAGVCTTGPCEGCMAAGACNFNTEATIDDGSCAYVITSTVDIHDLLDVISRWGQPMCV